MKSYLLILVCLLLACSNSNPPTTKNILPENIFTSILKEIHLKEAMLQSNKKNYHNTEYIKIYNNHQVSQNEFQLTLNYYYKNPNKLEQVYIDILHQLNEEKSKLDQPKTN